MDLGISGRTALITGAGQGIGAGVALSLAREGVKVAINDVVEERAEKAIKRVIEAGGKAIAVIADVTDYEAVKGMVKRVTDDLGPVDILINNAGIPLNEDKRGTLSHKSSATGGALFQETDREFWDRTMNVITYGTMNCTHAVIEGMIERRWGRIINYVSNVIHGMEGVAAYSTAKSGLVGFTRSMACELGPHCITVNAICPLVITETGMHYFEERREQLLAPHPIARGLNRFATPTEVGDAIAFLVSERAWFTTGQIINMTGGLR